MRIVVTVRNPEQPWPLERLVAPCFPRHDARMLRRRSEFELEILDALRGLGLLLMSIDAHLEKLVILLGEGDEEADA